MLRWLTLLPLLFLLTLVSTVGAERQQPVPMVITIREIYNGRWLTFNQTLNGKFKRAILPETERSASNLNWSPDGTSMIIVDGDDGNLYRYQHLSQSLERMYYMSPFTPNKFVRWSDDGTSFFIVSPSDLLIFHDDRWHTFWNGLPGIEDAYWVGNRIVFTDAINGMTSIAADGTNRVPITSEFDRLIGIYGGAAYAYRNHILYKVDILTGVSQPVITFQSESEMMAISPDGQYLVYVGQGDTPHLANLETGYDEPLIQGPVSNRIDGFIWSPDSEHILIYHNDASYSGNWFYIDLNVRRLSQLQFYAGLDEVSWQSTQNRKWHPLWLTFGVAMALIVKHRLRIMVCVAG